jgi:hypothetical protein
MCYYTNPVLNLYGTSFAKNIKAREEIINPFSRDIKERIGFPLQINAVRMIKVCPAPEIPSENNL